MDVYSHQIMAAAVRPHLSATHPRGHAVSASHIEEHELLELLQSFETSETPLLDFSTMSSNTTTPDETNTLTTSPYLLTQSLSISPPPAYTLPHSPPSLPASAIDSNFFTATSPMQLSEAQEVVSPDDPRPRCYDHGCGGRPFANTENYRRHLRERSIQNKYECPYCSCSFTRKGNRDTHLASGRCKAVNAMLAEVDPTGAAHSVTGRRRRVVRKKIKS